jgi:beta-N-acetylhexosaminidase
VVTAVFAVSAVVAVVAIVWPSSQPRRTGVAPASAAPAVGTPSPSPIASIPPAGLDACVSATVAKLSLEERVGQVLMIGTPVADPQALTDTVGRYHLGGAFLAGRSTQPAATLRQAIQGLRTRATAAGVLPLQVAVDQEGGQVQTLKGTDFPTIPSAVEQGRWDDATLTARTAQWARGIAGVGVTLDLAPVADTVPAGTAGANPPIGKFDRQYGSVPDDVARDIGTVVSAVQSAGVLTTLKHFPGLGRVRANTDTSTAAVDPATTADDPFLKPFASGIAAGTGAVMISSARYPKLDPNAVAAFSAPIVTGLLRERMGFTGLIVSDDLGVAAAVGNVPIGQRAVRFVQAGGDLVLTIRQSDAALMVDALLAQARASSAFEARVTNAARQVVRSKYRVGLLTCPAASG